MSIKIYGYLILSALFAMFFLACAFTIGILKTLISIFVGIASAAIIYYAVSLIVER